MEKVEMSIMRVKIVEMGKLRIVLLHVEEDVGDERVDC